MQTTQHFIFLHGIGQVTSDWMPTITLLRKSAIPTARFHHAPLKANQANAIAAVRAQFADAIVIDPQVGQDVAKVLQVLRSSTVGVGHALQTAGRMAAPVPSTDQRWVIHNVAADYLLYGKEYTVQELSMALGHYIKQLKGDIHLIGFSMGGIVALDYITSHPDSVASQVVIGARHSLPNWLLTAQDKVLGMVPGRMFMPGNISKANYWTMANSFKDLDTTRKLASMNHCKTLVAIGDGDYLNRIQSNQLASRIPGAEFCVIPHSGHQVNVDNPKGLADMLTGFYGRII